MKNYGSWEFNNAVSRIYDQHIRQVVPGYDEIQNAISTLASFYIKDHSIVYDLGCGTGETLLRIAAKYPDKNLLLIGLDSSTQMLAVAKEKNRESKCAEFIHQDFAYFDFANSSNFITAVLAIQYISIPERLGIIKKVYDCLNPGGAFILVEKTVSQSAQTQDMYSQMSLDFQEKQGLMPQEILDTNKALRGILVPLPLEDNLRLLHEVGFQTDVFYKNLDLTGIIAIK